MEKISFEEKVRSIDWMKYLSNQYYDSEKMFFQPSTLVEALINLSLFDTDDKDLADKLGNEILFAFGNNHRGTYYPAALEAIDLIIEIEKNSDNEKARNFAKYTLNDLYYFQLEMPENDQSLFESIDSLIRKKLNPYSDEELKRI